MKLSKNFTLEEFAYSQTAAKKGLDNTPPPEVVERLRALCVNVLQPVREAYGEPIKVTSGYRSAYLNTLVKGSKTSQHLTGEAADLSVGNRAKNKELFDVIKWMRDAGNIDYDQLIDENNYAWVHVSFRADGHNRGMDFKL